MPHCISQIGKMDMHSLKLHARFFKGNEGRETGKTTITKAERKLPDRRTSTLGAGEGRGNLPGGNKMSLMGE